MFACQRWTSRWRRALWLSWIACWLLASASTSMAQPASARPAAPPEILILVSVSYGNPGVDRYLSGLVDQLRAHGLPLLNIHVEYLDLVRYPAPAYRQQMAQLMQQKYAGRPIHALLALQQPALNFVLNEAKALAPGATVLSAFAYVPPELENDGRNFIVQTPRYDFAGTLQRALELYPATKHVIFASGDSELELARQQDVRHQLEPWRARLTLSFTDQQPYTVALRALAQTAPDTVILSAGYQHDASGRVFVPLVTLEQIAALSNAPVFTMVDIGVVGKVLGGMAPRMDASVAALARAALGPPPREHLSMTPLEIVPVFNWAELQRRKLDPAALPANTVFLQREPSLWRQHRTVLLSMAGVILVLCLLLAALLWQYRRRRQAEATLQRREAYYRRQIEQAPEAILVLDFDQRRILDANPAAQRLFGASRGELLASWLPRWYADTQPDGRPVADSMWEHPDRALAGEHEVFERSVRNSAGDVVPCEVRVVSMDEPGRRLVRSSFIRLQDRPAAAQRRA